MTACYVTIAAINVNDTSNALCNVYVTLWLGPMQACSSAGNLLLVQACLCLASLCFLLGSCAAVRLGSSACGADNISCLPITEPSSCLLHLVAAVGPLPASWQQGPYSGWSSCSSTSKQSRLMPNTERVTAVKKQRITWNLELSRGCELPKEQRSLGFRMKVVARE